MDAKNDIVIKKYESADREEFKRPSHFDFMTHSELKKAGFSGVRHNSITDEMEIWILGEMKKAISKEDVELNPNIIEDTWAKLFAV